MERFSIETIVLPGGNTIDVVVDREKPILPTDVVVAERKPDGLLHLVV